MHIAAIKVIKSWAYSSCLGLTTVDLGEGVEEIEKGAFRECTSLQ